MVSPRSEPATKQAPFLTSTTAVSGKVLPVNIVSSELSTSKNVAAAVNVLSALFRNHRTVRSVSRVRSFMTVRNRVVSEGGGGLKNTNLHVFLHYEPF